MQKDLNFHLIPLFMTLEIQYLNLQLPDPYKVLEKVGEGGNRFVYRAEATKAGITYPCAVKVANTQRPTKRYVNEDPKDEVRALLEIAHANLERLFDFGELEDGRFWIATEFIDGENLETVVSREGPLKLSEFISTFYQVISAVEYLCRQHFAHRDLTLRNIMRTRDKTITVEETIKDKDFSGWARRSIGLSFDGPLVKITDFQLARKFAELEIEDRPWSRHYLPPFSYREGELMDPTVFDMYALGVCMYRAFTGKYPFDFTGKKTSDVIEFWESKTIDELGELFTQVRGDVRGNYVREDKGGIYGPPVDLKDALIGGFICDLLDRGIQYGGITAWELKDQFVEEILLRYKRDVRELFKKGNAPARS